MVSVAVIGSGAWGTTLALLLANKGITATLWEHRPERATEMRQQRENVLFLPGFHFPSMLHVTADIKEAVREKELLLLVTPSQRMRENVRLLAPYVGKETLLVSASKGIEIGTLKRMTEIVEEEFPGGHTRIAALSGPNIAREVAEGIHVEVVRLAVERGGDRIQSGSIVAGSVEHAAHELHHRRLASLVRAVKRGDAAREVRDFNVSPDAEAVDFEIGDFHFKLLAISW